MKLVIAAVGRMRPGPEKLLYDDYMDRFGRTGRGLGLGPAELREVEARKSGMAAEAALLEAAVPEGAYRIVLDERGKRLSSPDFAARLGDLRDDGRGQVALMIGGADGLAPELRVRADLALSFGAMVWPHMLVRVMLAEQLYRAASILAGSPYHRV